MQESTSATLEPSSDWERELADLLSELMNVQTDLLRVLGAKREAVGRNDLEAVDGLRPQTEALLERLQRCHDRRAQLLQFAARQGLPAQSLSKLATHAPAQRQKLGKQVKESAARMRLLQQQSLANWVLAQRSLLHIAQMLEIIATGGRLLPTYDRCGESSLTGGALVDHEA